jgi:2,5-diketo-D-gluconate reductase A
LGAVSDGLEEPDDEGRPLPAVGDFTETWHAMEEMYRSGRVKPSASPTSRRTTCAGCSTAGSSCPPSTRSRFTPTSPNGLRAFDAEHGIATKAWSPIAQGKVLDNPAITGTLAG